MENEEVIPETLNQDAETGDTADTSQEEVAAQLKKATEYAQNQKLRAEKAEQALKALKKPAEKETPKNDFSLADIRALANVHDDNYQDVIDFAKFKGISISEAKKHPTMQIILKTAEEERKSAEAANTGSVKRGVQKDSNDAILEQFNKGIIPEDDDGLRKLAEARMAQRKKK